MTAPQTVPPGCHRRRKKSHLPDHVLYARRLGIEMSIGTFRVRVEDWAEVLDEINQPSRARARIWVGSLRESDVTE